MPKGRLPPGRGAAARDSLPSLPPQPTLVSPLVSRGIVELQVNLPILPGFSPVFAVTSRLVGFVVNFGPKGVGELLGAAPTFFAEEVLLPEVFAEILIIAVRERYSAWGACGLLHAALRWRQ